MFVLLLCFVILCVVLSCALLLLFKATLRLQQQYDELQDEVTERVNKSLYALDTSYTQIVTVANKPVFFDSPEVRAVVNAICAARDAVQYVVESLRDELIVHTNDDIEKLEDVEYVGGNKPIIDTRSVAELDAEMQREIMQRVKAGEIQVIDMRKSHSQTNMPNRAAVVASLRNR